MQRLRWCAECAVGVAVGVTFGVALAVAELIDGWTAAVVGLASDGRERR